MRRTMLSLATVILLLVGTGLAMADTYQLNISSPSLGSCSVVIQATFDSGYGAYEVTSGGGTVNGHYIGVYAPSGTPPAFTMTPSGQLGGDDLFYSPPNANMSAVMFLFNSGLGEAVIYYTGDVGYEGYYSYSELTKSDDTFSDTFDSTDDVTIAMENITVPEPSFILFLGMGIGMVGLLAWRTRA